VKAYRDTWELGLHSYLTFLRDRLVLSRELLDVTGSVFVQISDENIHLVRSILDEIFGPDGFVSQISFTKTTGLEAADRLASRTDYILWYARRRDSMKYHPLFEPKDDPVATGFN